jgi:hypothetical protein
MQRIKELGIEMPEPSAPGNPAEPQTGATAPVVPAPAATPAPVPQQPVAEEINAMRKAAGLPVVEGVLTDSTGNTLDHICNRFGKEVRDFETSGDMSDDLYHALYDYYFDDMPYGTKKARDGDPYEWIADRFSQDRGLDESNSGMIMPEADMLNTFEVMSGFDAPAVHEGSCNSTMEGEYCPEHGLAECGYMESMGGTVAGNVGEEIRPVKIGSKLPQSDIETFGLQPGRGYDINTPKDWKKGDRPRAIQQLIPTQDKKDHIRSRLGKHTAPMLPEQGDDPMNYNAAVTGSYYESRESDSLLARIKSLALLK